MLLPIRTSALVAGLLALVGCAASSTNQSSIEHDRDVFATPADLTVDVTVLVGRGVPVVERVEQRTGRYIIFPDGSMHADIGPSLRADVRPGLTRRLRDDEARLVWAMLVDSGLADPERFDPPTNDAVLMPSRGIIAHLVTIEANGRRWQAIRALAPDAIAEADTTPLVRTLAGLAWESDTLPESLLPGGIRYEFGDDPHQAYRAVGVTPAAPARRGAGGER